MAARSYFGKPAKRLTLDEGALLAGLTKGPNFYNPDRHPERARERLAYVLSRMQEDGVIEAGAIKPAGACRRCRTLVAYERPRRDVGFHFVDQVAREAKALAGLETIDRRLLHGALDDRSAICSAPPRRRCRKGCARYERNAGRRRSSQGAEANLGRGRRSAIESGPAKPPSDKRPRLAAGARSARLPLYDVHWTPRRRGGKPGAQEE